MLAGGRLGELGGLLVALQHLRVLLGGLLVLVLLRRPLHRLVAGVEEHIWIRCVDIAVVCVERDGSWVWEMDVGSRDGVGLDECVEFWFEGCEGD